MSSTIADDPPISIPQDTPPSAPTKGEWPTLAAKSQTLLRNSIPSSHRIPSHLLPSAERKNVVAVCRESGVFEERELKIVEGVEGMGSFTGEGGEGRGTSAGEILEKIKAGEWSAEEVVGAFCRRASWGSQLTNCLTVTLYDRALARARHLDQHYKSNPTSPLLGPLHGLPVSIKDNFNIKGYPSSVGFTAWALDPQTTDSTLVTTLENLGAVVFCKTNVPTAMMIPETVNNVYGRTVNPINRGLSSGGSSGGESALIAFGGSVVGVGTDIGGSLRIPASTTSLFTLKPSLGRFPHFDARTALAGQESIPSVQGPITRHFSDLTLFSRALVSSSPWLRDPKCIEIPWRDVTLPTKLKIAVLWSNGTGAEDVPTPPVSRALRETVETLRAKGDEYEIVDWDPMQDHLEAQELVGRFFLADGGASVRNILSETDEPVRPEMLAYDAATEMGVYEYWQLQKRRTALQGRILRRWEALGVDAVLGPTTQYVAPRNGGFNGSLGYTMVWNLVDYACVSFPCGVRADRGKDGRMGEGEVRGLTNERDRRVQEEYDAEEVHGMEVSLQLAGGRLREERVLAITERVLRSIGK